MWLLSPFELGRFNVVEYCYEKNHRGKLLEEFQILNFEILKCWVKSREIQL